MSYCVELFFRREYYEKIYFTPPPPPRFLESPPRFLEFLLIFLFFIIPLYSCGGGGGGSGEGKVPLSQFIRLKLSAQKLSPTQIRLSWSVTGDISKIAGYNLYREGSQYNPIYVDGKSASHFEDFGLTPLTNYCYSISPVDASGNELDASRDGRNACADTDSPDTAMMTFDMSSSRVSGSDIIVSWKVSGAAPGLSGYRVERNGQQLDFQDPSRTSYKDSTTELGLRYCYKVTAVDVAQNELGHGEFCASREDSAPPSVPSNITASAVSESQIYLLWNASTDNTGVTGYKIYRNGSHVATVQDSSYIDIDLSPSSKYCYQVSAIDAVGNESGVTSASCATTSNQSIVKLNDTGITKWANETDSNLTASLPYYPGQDADYGRDKTHNDDVDGHAGFNFTKIGANGEVLPVVSANWSAVLDNVTGLMWENKTDDDGLHDMDWTYSWYQLGNNINGGDPGTQNGGDCGGTITSADTYSFVQAVNQEKFCGYSDWRMPTKKELRSIVNFEIHDPAIDVRFFSHNRYDYYWSSSPFANSASVAWVVNLNNGHDWWYYKSSWLFVRLVRGRQ